MSTVILLASAADDPAGGLRSVLSVAGFAVVEAAFGTTLPDLASVAAVVVCAGPGPVPASGFVRLLRAELGEQILPVVWIAPDADILAAGLDAGADAGLTRPVDPVAFLAQVRAAVRLRSLSTKLAERADEARTLNDRLRKVYQQSEADAQLIAQAGRVALPRHLPTLGGVRFGVCHRLPALSVSTGGSYGAAQLDADRLGFWVTDAAGVLGLTVCLAARGLELRDGQPQALLPGEVLDRANRALIALEADPPPLVGMAYGAIEVRSGTVTVSRGGLPPAVFLPAHGEPQPWTGPGPFLGAFDAEFPPCNGVLAHGDRLILATAGDAEGLTAAADRHRGLTAQNHAEAIAGELVDGGDAVTVLVVERSE